MVGCSHAPRRMITGRGDLRRVVRRGRAAGGSAAHERRALPSVQAEVGHRAEEDGAGRRDGGLRLEGRADAAELLSVRDTGGHARSDEHAREAPGSKSQHWKMSHDAEADVSIRDWHAGRLVLVWVAAAAIYWFGRSVW